MQKFYNGDESFDVEGPNYNNTDGCIWTFDRYLSILLNGPTGQTENLKLFTHSAQNISHFLSSFRYTVSLHPSATLSLNDDFLPHAPRFGTIHKCNESLQL
jgi:hypothetical protein